MDLAKNNILELQEMITAFDASKTLMNQKMLDLEIQNSKNDKKYQAEIVDLQSKFSMQNNSFDKLKAQIENNKQINDDDMIDIDI